MITGGWINNQSFKTKIDLKLQLTLQGGETLIRLELCDEAIRLAQLIGDSRLLDKKHPACALLALMLLSRSRFDSRIDNQGAIVELAKQDRTCWDKEMIKKGIGLLHLSIDDHTISSITSWLLFLRTIA